jgi:hypothetical protein
MFAPARTAPMRDGDNGDWAGLRPSLQGNGRRKEGALSCAECQGRKTLTQRDMEGDCDSSGRRGMVGAVLAPAVVRCDDVSLLASTRARAVSAIVFEPHGNLSRCSVDEATMLINDGAPRGLQHARLLCLKWRRWLDWVVVLDERRNRRGSFVRATCAARSRT